MGGNSNSYVFSVRIITRFQIFAYLTNSQFCVTDYVRIILVDSNDGLHYIKKIPQSRNGGLHLQRQKKSRKNEGWRMSNTAEYGWDWNRGL